MKIALTIATWLVIYVSHAIVFYVVFGIFLALLVEYGLPRPDGKYLIQLDLVSPELAFFSFFAAGLSTVATALIIGVNHAISDRLRRRAWVESISAPNAR